MHIEETVITDTPYYINSNHPDLVGVKTSLTHPMNVSPLIPPELLPLYGQSILHAVPVSATSYSDVDVYSNTPNQRARSPLGKLTMHDLPPGSNLNNTTTTGARPPSPTKSTASASGSSAMHISRPTTPANGSGEEKIYLHEVLDHVIDSGYMKKPFVIQPSADIHALTGPNASAALFNLTLPISQQLAMTSTLNSDGDYGSESSASMFTSGSAIRLGNLVLSSCPGKKVRLSDRHLEILGIPEICRPGIDPATQIPILDPRTLPKAGVTVTQQSLMINRSPICRDLELDLRRAIEQADIKAVVCCIDDEELKFLGAAWVEYEKVARKLDLEVIR